MPIGCFWCKPLVSNTSREQLKNTKHKWLAVCFSVSVSIMFGSNYSEIKFQTVTSGMQIEGVQNHVSWLWTATSIKMITECLNQKLPHMGFEHDLCQAVMINLKNKVLRVLTIKPLLEARKLNTKAIFIKTGWLLFLKILETSPG